MMSFRVMGYLGLVCLPALVVAQAPSRTGSSRAGFDVLHYDFTVDFRRPARPDTLDIVSEVTVMRTGAARSIALDLVPAFAVRDASVNGAAVTATREGDQVTVPLPAGQRDTLRLRLRYAGRPTDGLILSADSSGGWTAFGDNFPHRARQWLATVDHPSDKATVAWTVRAPSTHRVIANGALLEETPEPGRSGMTVTRYATARPLYTSVMVIGVAPFAVYELGDTACGLGELPGCVRQSVWITPDVRDYMPGPFRLAGEMVAWMSRVIGPFPYEKLAHVQSTTRYGGMENASAIFYADAIYKRRSMDEGLIAHETAHQWFGDAVTTREWPHVWLSEGFATYFAALWTEHAHGDSTFRGDMERMRTSVLGLTMAATTPVVNTQLANVANVLNGLVYQKAGFVLHMLRREVGDSAFFRGIRSYYQKYRHGNALTDDFRREVESAAGRPLDWFFDQWLHRPGTAELDVAWQWDASRRTLEVTATQAGTAAPYRLNLALDVTDPTGRTERVRVTLPATRVATVPVAVKLTGAPRSVAVDPDVTILGRVTVRK
ncbi:MAG: M1 family metallopeptidase [Gemmatimonadetes bacterium]|nr:M1 family metallopeptidase [Gemmatimonadota bacterium]